MSLTDTLSEAIPWVKSSESKQKAIPTQMNSLQVEIESLYSTISELEEKLKPVLGPSAETKINEAPLPVPLVPLAATVSEKVSGVKKARVDIEALIKRIEI